MKNLWLRIRPYGRVVNAFFGFLYDFRRFYRYGGWRGNTNDIEERNYCTVKTYHSLEKSMSFTNRNEESGWGSAYALLQLLKAADRDSLKGFHDHAGHKVLSEFLALKYNAKTNQGQYIERELQHLSLGSAGSHGTKSHTAADFQRGRLVSPEDFFLSRYSLREFSDQPIDIEIIRRALWLAMKSPSVCNRQPWHVYHTTDQVIKESALRHQAGNRGFGHKIPNLLILATDLKAFMPGQEHYQHWIDGGLLSMSLIYALHSLGVATCCLNWSQSPANDKLIRSLVDIKDHHTIIMLLAAGWPNDDNRVCVSARRPLEEVFTELR